MLNAGYHESGSLFYLKFEGLRMGDMPVSPLNKHSFNIFFIEDCLNYIYPHSNAFCQRLYSG